MHDGAVCEKLSAQLPTKLKYWSIQQSPRYQYEQPALLKRDTAVVLFHLDSASFCCSRYALYKET